jgi:hypothetical protein
MTRLHVWALIALFQTALAADRDCRRQTDELFGYDGEAVEHPNSKLIGRLQLPVHSRRPKSQPLPPKTDYVDLGGILLPKYRLISGHVNPATGRGYALDVNLIEPLDLSRALKETKSRGFWTLFTPVGGPADSRVALGHQMVVVNGKLYGRNVDQDALGKAIQLELNLEGNQGAEWLPERFASTFVLAQYFDMTAESTQSLSNFFEWRTRALNLGPWFTVYRALPSHPVHSGPNVENCTHFAWSFLDQNWIDRVPELNLAAVGDDLGELNLSDIPNLQIAHNTLNRSFRGTVMTHPSHPLSLMQLAKSDALRLPPYDALYLARPLRDLPEAIQIKKGELALENLGEAKP